MTKTMTKTQAVAKVKTELTQISLTDWAITGMNPGEIGELFEENFGGEGLDPLSLTTVKVPSGGGLQWEMEGLEGPEYSTDIFGVIVGIQKGRKYWQTGLDEGGGGTPPDCQSHDLEHGIGSPGGLCDLCPLNKFGSDGAGKACKESWRVFLLQADSIIPFLVNFPATSLRTMKRYQLALTSKRLRYYNVLTRLTLEREKSSSGINYSKIKLEYAGVMDAASMATIADYVGIFKTLVQQTKPVALAQISEERSPESAIMARMRAGQAAADRARMEGYKGDRTDGDDRAAAEGCFEDDAREPPWAEGIDIETRTPSGK